jgi:hypothetical protein
LQFDEIPCVLPLIVGPKERKKEERENKIPYDIK